MLHKSAQFAAVFASCKWFPSYNSLGHDHFSNCGAADDGDGPVQLRDLVVAMTYIIVIFSIVVQALTIGARRRVVRPEPAGGGAAEHH